ncbi:MAG: Phosphoribulokinase, plasmid [Nitrosomonadaceae bacterium]|nr:phosphoribulokinase [Nitrosospira sp.]MBI0413726.1 phosphoribulokinase [Nitrosospira sp.]MCG3772318.1 Phosphoribulokinase, plasmid [Nitrosomonadaceae bacterium]MSQ44832.1 phosphoribulokinase [Nitrosomonadaceae bacterium]GDX59230.1 phosphoribulokinase [Nitrosomonadaceae bacterium]
MSQKHPVIAVTGSSGAGTSTVKNSFEHIFHREELSAVVVEGDSFHRYDRDAMKKAVAESEKGGGRPISHFGPEANEFEKLEALFKEYGKTGKGQTRLYLHNDDEAAPYKQKAGTFTPWSSLVPGSDLLFYEGLHGGVKSDTADVAKHVDLLVGVVPIVNLEWIQKIRRDTSARGYSAEAVTHTILRRMHDYVHYITPQFSRTHVNFQRVPTVDTSNPFIAREIPTLDESFVVIRFRDPKSMDFPYLLSMIHDSFMSRPNTIVVPGGKMGLAIELILTPLILTLVAKSKK